MQNVPRRSWAEPFRIKVAEPLSTDHVVHAARASFKGLRMIYEPKYLQFLPDAL